jgi:hypothetical protein
MTLTELRDALLGAGVPVFHYFAAKQPDKYIVWAEEGQTQAAGYGDNRSVERILTGTVDYFTKTDLDPVAAVIAEILNGLDIASYLASVQYEDETRFIHHEWIWEMVT